MARCVRRPAPGATAIRENRPSETSGDECLRDLAASFAIVESSLAGRAVALGDVLDGSVDAYQRDLDEHYGLLGG